MSVPPDTKDWTWVIEGRCAECGFDPTTVTREGLAGRLRSSATGWSERLAAPDAGRRPAPSVWSPTEYAAHVADVGRVMGGRLALILEQHDPVFANWDQDAAAVDGDYASREPAAVAADLGRSVAALADRYDDVPPDAWDRPGRRSNGSVFTAFTLGVYALHDVEHHRHDVGISA